VHDGQGKEATGTEAGDDLGGSSDATTGAPATHHWKEGTISEPGLGNRGSVFFAAVEMTRMPMILTDPNLPDNPIVFANRAFHDLTGYTQEEVLGRNCRFLQGARTDRETVREMRDAVRAHQAVSVDVLNYKRDGTPFWNGVFIGPIHDEKGGILYFFASQLDITRRRSSEQAFRQAQKMESIGQLTAGLAHDFNNLLQVVYGNIETALDGAIDEPARRALATAHRASERGVRLTRQLLAFARKTRLDPRPIDLSAIVQEFGDLLDSAVGGGAELRLDLRRRMPTCLVDPIYLEMALLNVVNNAKDAMPEGGTVTVATSVVRLGTEAEALSLAPGDYACLDVRDDGTGMPSHVAERATEPFFTTKEAGRGTGLGLAMAHGFVQQSLGRLTIESEPGAGTRVRMLFPAVSTVAETRTPQQADPVPERLGADRSILVVEDGDDVRALAVQHLSALGYRTLEARSGEEALAIFEREGGGIDLVFTDLVMPGGMTGLALADRIREDNPHIPILLTTGYNEELVAEGTRKPAMDVLGKPYRRSELADRVNAALNGSRDPVPVLYPAPSGPRHEG
jgi:PAS domain S-box-containing protein